MSAWDPAKNFYVRGDGDGVSLRDNDQSFSDLTHVAGVARHHCANGVGAFSVL
jgi:hypothetical protein